MAGLRHFLRRCSAFFLHAKESPKEDRLEEAVTEKARDVVPGPLQTHLVRRVVSPEDVLR